MHIAIVVPAYSVGSHMGGIGVRAWELAQTLDPSWPVTVIAKGDSDFDDARITFTQGDRRGWVPVIENCDAAVFYDLPDTEIMLAAHRAGKFIISEAAVPIEHLGFDRIRNGTSPDDAYAELVARFELQVLLSDHFIVRSEVGLATLVAALSMAGRLAYSNYELSTTVDHLWTWVPIGFSADSAGHAARAEALQPPVDFLWTGGIWDFYDPVAVVRAIARLKAAGQRVSLRFMYKPPPGQRLEEARRLLQAIDDYAVSDLVDFCEPTPTHHERNAVCAGARAAICIGRPGIENQTSIRLRLRDSFLYRLPFIVDKHGATGRLVESLGMGTSVDSGDCEELATAMSRVTGDRDFYATVSSNLARVRPDYLLDPHVKRLCDNIEGRKKAPDIGSPRHGALVESLISRFPALTQPPSYPY